MGRVFPASFFTSKRRSGRTSRLPFPWWFWFPGLLPYGGCVCVVNVAEVPAGCCVVMLISPDWASPERSAAWAHGRVCRGCWVPFSTGPEGHDYEAELESLVACTARQKHTRRSPEQTPDPRFPFPPLLFLTFPGCERKSAVSRRDRVSHGTSFCAPGSLARRRLQG